MRFPTLRPVIMDIIVQVLSGERDHAREIVEAIIDSEQNYLFTNDLDYKENRSSIVPQQEEPPQYDQNGNRIYPQNNNQNKPNPGMQ